MKNYLIICCFLSASLFSCQNAPPAAHPAVAPTEAAASSDASAKKEKELLEKEKELLEKELALIKKQNEMHKSDPPVKNAAKTVDQASKSEEQKKEKVDLTKGITNTVLHCDNKKFTIKIDRLDNGKIRYASWNKPKSINDTPDLILYDPLVKETSVISDVYTFYNKGWHYIIEMTINPNSKDESSAKLRLWKKDKEMYASDMTVL